MKVGDRVKTDLGGSFGESIGTIKKITNDGFTVVVWDKINGEWYRTKEQAKQLEVINGRES